jgi:methylthioribose-1-phosphate isomerase
MWPTIEWKDGKVVLIDQRKLPLEESYVECRDEEDISRAIETMVIRGAPAIGIAAAYGVALAVMNAAPSGDSGKEFDRAVQRLAGTRPTARNLFWALERMKRVHEENRLLPCGALGLRLLREAQEIETEDLETNRTIGSYGKELIEEAGGL